MSTDDQEKQSEKERLLEEIRRRAEEAELRRLEEEETGMAEPPRGGAPPVQEVPPPEASAPPSPPHGRKAAPPPKSVLAQKVLVLRERLTIALDRGKIDKAVDILAELSGLIPESPEVEEFRQRIERMQQERRQAAEKKRGSTDRRPTTEAPSSRETKGTQRKRILELLDSAQNDYQQEKYDSALESVESVLKLDANNEDGQKLKQQIIKAQRIADLIKREEARSRAEEAVLHPAKQESEKPIPRGDEEVWGTSTTVQRTDLGIELPPEEKGPLAPPKPPLMHRVTSRISRVKIPKKAIATIAAILLLAAVGYFVVEGVRHAVSPPLHSILIYPAVVQSGDSAASWTADGLTSDLICDFSAISRVRVIAGETSFGLRGSSRDVLTAARNLGANYAVQLSLSREGEQVVFQSTLYDTLKGHVIWTTTNQASLRELPTARLELVRKILSVIDVVPKPEEDAALHRPPTSTSRSYDLYLRARSMLLRSNRYPAGKLIDAFQQAVAADSLYADAHAGLGWAYVLAYESDRNPKDAYLTQARWSVQHALSLTRRSAEIFRVWGVTEQYAGQRLKAVERLEQAVAVAPSDAGAQRRLAVAYLSTGRNDLSLSAAQRAVIDDPGSVDSYTTLAEVQQFSGDYRGAYRNYDLGLRLATDKSEYASGGLADVLVSLQQHDRAIEILTDRVARARTSYSDYYKLGRVEQLAGRPKTEWFMALQKAKTLIEERVKEDPRDADAASWKALVHTLLGEFKDAAMAVKQAQEVDPNDVDVLYNTARMYARQGEKSQANEFLKRAVERQYSLPRILDLDFNSLRSDGEFLRIVAR
jgi:tetratricopeptide (TPR) repeat protein